MTLRNEVSRDPTRFAFDAAVRVLLHAARTADVTGAVRFTTPPHLAYPAAEVTAVSSGAAPVSLQTTVIGMTGPSGVLPRGYTELVTSATRGKSPSLQAFLDVLAQRFVAAYAEAGRKYRPHSAAETALLAGSEEPVGRALLAFTGYATADLSARLTVGNAALKHYAGFFAARPRSADRLAALASDWLGRPVQVKQFVGTWLDLPESERTMLSGKRSKKGAFCRLGIDAVAGVRAWDVQSRVIIVVGPLDLPEFDALLPGGSGLRRLVSLVRAFLGFETDFAVNPTLLREAVPPLQLGGGGASAPLLGWNTWLCAPASARLRDPDDAVFEADVIEAEAVAAP
jgi:type VI secretion system protein ImpH